MWYVVPLAKLNSIRKKPVSGIIVNYVLSAYSGAALEIVLVMDLGICYLALSL